MGITLGRDDPTDGALSVVQPQEAALPAFFQFAQTVQRHGALRTAITEACLQPEADALQPLLAEAELPPVLNQKIHSHARALVESQRTNHQAGGIKALIREYSLSSEEGVALMCLAEALLRIPDGATRDALIRDKLSTGDWQAHLGQSQSLFVNAATWGLLVSGRIVAPASAGTLGSALARLAAKGGGPLIQCGVSLAMRMMGSQFVSGRSIEEALTNARWFEAQGFRYSYDMLGEASTTAADAQRYYDDYFQAIHAIGKVAGGRGIYEGPGISIKLSALHPRYSRANLERVRVELHPRVVALARLACRYDIGLNIDAEEADRLEISLDVLECLCADTELAGWHGIGFVVQAYQKRAPAVVDYLVDLGRRTGHRLMVRLVKGAYWDSEIKRAQIDGLEGFPVYTRKVHTDVSYLACARRLLAASDAVFPQFATHNAHTLASIYAMAGQNFHSGQYEFQCLHGMGEPLYQEIVGRGAQSRPCRIYAPVGAHETLLAYLVRRLLENGANSSFVSRIADSTITIDELIASPVEAARGGLCSPHPKISLPRDILGTRNNSAGVDLSNERNLAALSQELLASNSVSYRAAPMPCPPGAVSALELVRNPANRNDVVGAVTLSSLETVHTAVSRSVSADGIWRCCPAKQRAQILRRAANVLEQRMPALLALIVREAGKSLTNAVAEVREGIDFLRYYAEQIGTDFSNENHHALGPVACISPWNFPLAIFLGQVSAALAAGNTVLAKPAEETPLIAAQIVQLLWEAGVPDDVLQLLPGDGEIGAALVSDARVRGVIFTGSTAVARLISRTLAQRLNPDGKPVPLIAETGGINAMVVDSSALAEQVVGDVLVSAFDSAGQRCSALRLLCLQDEIADHVLTMLKGAMAELATGNPDKLSVDVGPVITVSAQRSILDYVQNMRDRQCGVHQCPSLGETANGIFVPPTLIEISHVSELGDEVFGPVLHVVRYKRGWTGCTDRRH
jgi:RHH-type transcriptional regulator, proline utilization regulon repressor / proline dehydrogenase / delta 1-pyrroline-5-carboxylate dehydrogenase